MRVTEIEYASGIQSISQHLTLADATPIGSVDTHTVYQQQLADISVYLLADGREILAYIAVDGNLRLKQVENIKKFSGAITSILYFLTNKLGYKIRIDGSEPLTADGLRWLTKLISSDRKLFKITDHTGTIPSIVDLEQEWEDNRIYSKDRGEISITIEHQDSNSISKIFEAATTVVKSAYRILKDPALD